MGIRTWGLALLGVLIIGEQSLGETSSLLSMGEKMEVARKRCAPRALDEPYFFMDMYKSSMSFKEMTESYKLTYNQQERLFNRAGYDKGSKSFITSDGDKLSVTLPEKFIESVILHVENALKLNYVEYIFFPDMGHSHIQIPQTYYDKHYTNSPIQKAPLSLNEYLKTPGVKSLYHTAEKLYVAEGGVLLPDWYSQWRFYTRNLLGDSTGNFNILTDKKSLANTVSKVPGYRWNYGISLSAHKNGCFPFEDKSGKIQYFDISAWYPPYDCVNNFCG